MTQRPTTVRIPRPCAQPWAAMSPTPAGRHCAVCQTEVVDFTRMSQAEIIKYLAGHQAQSVCARMAAPVAPAPRPRGPGPRRWLLALAVLLGWQPASALPPQPLPKAALAAAQKQLIIQGVVLDGLLNVPVEEAFVFINDTKYGAVTDARGRFLLRLPADWEPVKTGVLTLRIKGEPFTFLEKLVKIDLTSPAKLAHLTIFLSSQPERGVLMGKANLPEPPVSVPLLRKNR